MLTRNHRAARGDNELTQLAGRFVAEPEAVRQALRGWLEDDSPGFTRAGVHHLAQDPASPVAGCVSLLLSRDELYLFYLTDPAELTQQQAANAARVLSKGDKRFFVKLTDFAGDSLSDDRLTRVLQLADTLGAAGLMVPWLRRMTRHEDGYIRQRAVMIMCQAGSNPMLVEKQLQSTDARVRANAVESLWTVATPAARALLEFAAQDTNHRVALNALVGLFMQGDATAVERMAAHARNSSPAFRIAAAWALGHTGKADARPALNELLGDPIEQVRESAVRALEKVPKPKIVQAPVPEPVIATAQDQARLNLQAPRFLAVP